MRENVKKLLKREIKEFLEEYGVCCNDPDGLIADISIVALNVVAGGGLFGLRGARWGYCG